MDPCLTLVVSHLRSHPTRVVEMGVCLVPLSLPYLSFYHASSACSESPTRKGARGAVKGEEGGLLEQTSHRFVAGRGGGLQVRVRLDHAQPIIFIVFYEVSLAMCGGVIWGVDLGS